jgi:hypothetical protein
VKVVAGLGLFEFPFSGAGAFWRWVDLCEAGGVDSLWHSDRLCGDTPALECMSVMAALAGATRRLKFGMNVASAGLRDPLLLACQCATIDTLSDGRLCCRPSASAALTAPTGQRRRRPRACAAGGPTRRSTSSPRCGGVSA